MAVDVRTLACLEWQEGRSFGLPAGTVEPPCGSPGLVEPCRWESVVGKAHALGLGVNGPTNTTLGSECCGQCPGRNCRTHVPIPRPCTDRRPFLWEMDASDVEMTMRPSRIGRAIALISDNQGGTVVPRVRPITQLREWIATTLACVAIGKHVSVLVLGLDISDTFISKHSSSIHTGVTAKIGFGAGHGARIGRGAARIETPTEEWARRQMEKRKARRASVISRAASAAAGTQRRRVNTRVATVDWLSPGSEAMLLQRQRRRELSQLEQARSLLRTATGSEAGKPNMLSPAMQRAALARRRRREKTGGALHDLNTTAAEFQKRERHRIAVMGAKPEKRTRRRMEHVKPIKREPRERAIRTGRMPQVKLEAVSLPKKRRVEPSVTVGQPDFGVGAELVRAGDLKLQLEIFVVCTFGIQRCDIRSKLTGAVETMRTATAIKLASRLFKAREKHQRKLTRSEPARMERQGLAELGSDVSRGARVQRLRALQTIGREGQAILKTAEGQSEVALQAYAIAQTFFIPGTRPWEGSSVEPEMRRVEQMLTRAWRPGTWRKLGPAWKRARAFIISRMETDKLEFCIVDLAPRQFYITAAAVHAYDTRSAVAAVADCLQACHKAMRISHIVVQIQVYDDVITRIAKLERSSALRKVAAITLTELTRIVNGAVIEGVKLKGWGHRSQPLLLRQCALQMELSFYKLLRFSCAAIVNIFFVYWMGKHLAYKLLRRKNDQAGELQWQVLAWTSKNCLAQRFRDFVTDTNPGLDIPAWGFAKSKKFVFRAVGPPTHKVSGHNHTAYCVEMGIQDVIVGDGSLPISCEKSRRSYRRLVSLMRLAMFTFNKYTQKQCKVFASQSLRRGGDTALWKNGATKEVRMAMGCWRTPEVELEYLETEVESQLAFDAKLWAKRSTRLKRPAEV